MWVDDIQAECQLMVGVPAKRKLLPSASVLATIGFCNPRSED